MWHPHPHISSDIDARGCSTLNIFERVVQQYFVVTDVNAGSRHAGELTVEGRSQRLPRVGAPQVRLHEIRDLRTSKKGIGVGARLVGRARESEIGNRRKHSHSGYSVGEGGLAADA